MQLFFHSCHFKPLYTSSTIVCFFYADAFVLVFSDISKNVKPDTEYDICPDLAVAVLKYPPAFAVPTAMLVAAVITFFASPGVSLHAAVNSITAKQVLNYATNKRKSGETPANI
jgi:hypothetical protein